MFERYSHTELPYSFWIPTSYLMDKKTSFLEELPLKELRKCPKTECAT